MGSLSGPSSLPTQGPHSPLPSYAFNKYLNECSLTKELQRRGRSAIVWEKKRVYPAHDMNSWHRSLPMQCLPFTQQARKISDGQALARGAGLHGALHFGGAGAHSKKSLRCFKAGFPTAFAGREPFTCTCLPPGGGALRPRLTRQPVGIGQPCAQPRYVRRSGAFAPAHSPRVT